MNKISKTNYQGAQRNGTKQVPFIPMNRCPENFVNFPGKLPLEMHL